MAAPNPVGESSALAADLLAQFRKTKAVETPTLVPSESGALAADMLQQFRQKQAASAVTPRAVAPGPPVLPPAGGLVPSAPGVAPPPSPPVGAAATRPAAVAVPPPSRPTAQAAARPSPQFKPAVEQMRQDTKLHLAQIKQPTNRMRGGGVPLSHPLGQGTMGVILGQVARPGENPWDAYNRRRLQLCIDCHKAELTPEGRPQREVPLGQPGPGKVIVGSRTKAYWGTPEEALNYYDMVRHFLTTPENKKANPNWQRDVAALDQAKAELAGAVPSGRAPAAAVPKLAPIHFATHPAEQQFWSSREAFVKGRQSKMRMPATRLREKNLYDQSLAGLGGALPDLNKELATHAQQINQESAAVLEAEARLGRGFGNAAQAQAIKRQRQTLNAKIALFKEREKAVQNYQKRWQAWVKTQGDKPIHGGMFYEGELPKAGEFFTERVLPYIVPSFKIEDEKRQANRRKLMLTGRYPMLPEIPGNVTPETRAALIRRKNNVLQWVQLETENPRVAAQLGGREGYFRSKGLPWAAWEEKLLPVLRQQHQAEVTSLEGTEPDRALFADIAMWEVGRGFGKLAAVGTAGALAGRIPATAMRVAPTLAPGIPTVAAGAAGGYAGSFTGAATATGVMGGTPAEMFEAGERAGKFGAALGAGMGALTAAVGQTIRGIRQARDFKQIDQLLDDLRQRTAAPLTEAELNTLPGKYQTNIGHLQRRIAQLESQIAEINASGDLGRIGEARAAAEALARAQSRLPRAINEAKIAARGKQPPQPEAPPAAPAGGPAAPKPGPKPAGGAPIKEKPVTRGPVANVPDVGEVPLRQTPRAPLVTMAPSSPEVQQHLQDRDNYDNWLAGTPTPIETVGQQTKQWSTTQNPARIQVEMFKKSAAAATDQNVTDALTRAAQHVENQWTQNFRRGVQDPNVTADEINNAVAPPEVSPWRQLTPEQQAALPTPVQTALLVQDVVNSQQVLDPTSAAFFTPKEAGTKSRADLEQKANDLFAQAQQHYAAVYAPTPMAGVWDEYGNAPEDYARGDFEVPGFERPARRSELGVLDYEIEAAGNLPGVPAGVGAVPEVVSPVAGQPAATAVATPPELQVGQRVRAPEVLGGQPLEIINTSDPSTVTVRTSAGGEAKIGRTALANAEVLPAGQITAPATVLVEEVPEVGAPVVEEVKPKAKRAQQPKAITTREADEIEAQIVDLLEQRDGYDQGSSGYRQLTTQIKKLRKRLGGPSRQAEKQPKAPKSVNQTIPVETVLTDSEGTQWTVDKPGHAVDPSGASMWLTPGNLKGMTVPKPKKKPAAKPKAKAPAAEEKPAYAGPERRQPEAAVQRKRVAEMTPEEQAAELLTSPKAGLPNGRAYWESDKKDWQSVLDVDGLGYVNKQSVIAGDAMIAGFGDLLRIIAEQTGVEFYHISGDEFIAQDDDRGKLEAALASMQELLPQIEFAYQSADGETHVYRGMEASYAVGRKNKEQGAFGDRDYRPAYADTAEGLDTEKDRRRAEGLRVPKGERPPGLVEVTGGEQAPEGREELPVQAAERERGTERAEEVRVSVAEEAAPAKPAPKPRAEKVKPMPEAGRKGGEVSLAGRGISEEILVSADWQWDEMKEEGGIYLFHAPGRQPPAVDRALRAIASGFRRAFTLLAQAAVGSEEWSKIGGRVGLTTVGTGDFSPYGFNILHSNGRQSIFVNPFLVSGHGATTYRSVVVGARDTPENVARSIATVTLHEIAHTRTRVEGEPLWATMDEMMGAIGEEDFNRAVGEIWQAITGGRDDFSPEYRKARDEYFKSLGEPGGEVTFGDTARFARAGPPTGERPGEGVPGREEGTSPDLGKGRRITPQVQQRTGEPRQDPPATDFEAYYRRNNGAPREKDAEIWAQRMKRMLDEASRRWKHLPRTPEYAELQLFLIRLESGRELASQEAMIEMADIVRGLNRAEFDLFNMMLVNRDMMGQINRWNTMVADGEAEGEWKGPEGMTEIAVLEGRDNLEFQLAANPKVEAAVAKRTEVMERIKDEYRKAVTAVLGKPPKMDIEDYFRHQVMKYLAEDRPAPQGTGQALKAPTYRGFLKARGFSEEAYNSSWTEAEHEVLSQMIYDTQLYRLLKYIERWDIKPQLMAQAAQMNEAAIQGELEAGSPAALEALRRLARNGELPDTMAGKWAHTIIALKGDQDLTDGEVAQLRDYVAWLTKQARTSAGSRIGKAILGKRRVRWEDLVPDGYMEFQPQEGNVFYRAWSVPDRIAEQLMNEGASAIGLDPSDIKRVFAMGGKRRIMVLPNPVGLTITNFTRPYLDSLEQDYKRGAAKLLGYWKGYQLLNPQRFVGYNLRNEVTDLEMFLFNPDGMRYMWQSLRELLGFMAKLPGGEYASPSPQLRAWLRRGGMQATLQSAEHIGSGEGLDLLAKFASDRALKGEDVWKEVQGGAVERAAWNRVWSLVRGSTDLREAVARYAHFLSYRTQIERSDAGLPANFGASDRNAILLIENYDDRAYKLSNELIGAYDDVSELGRLIAQNWVPFWRWQEVNWRRTLGLVRNDIARFTGGGGGGGGGKPPPLGGGPSPEWDDDDDVPPWEKPWLIVKVGARIATMAGLRVGRLGIGVLIGLGVFSLKAHVLSMSLYAWNRAKWGDLLDKIPEYDRGRPLLIVGYNERTDEVIYYTRLGAFQDVASWFGWDNAWGYAEAWANGRMGIKDIAIEVAKQPVDKILTSLGPAATFWEMATGRTLFPDPFDPREIRDRGEHLFDSFSLGQLYRRVQGIPEKRGAWQRYIGAKVAQVGETNYNEMYGLARKFLKSKGKTGPSAGAKNPRGNALYGYKRALKAEDKDAALHYLIDYAKAKGTDDGYATSMKTMDPLFGMKDEEEEEFLNNLSPADRRRMLTAYRHWGELFEAKMPSEDALESKKFVRQIHTLKNRIIRAIEQEQPLRRLKRTRPELKATIREAERAAR